VEGIDFGSFTTPVSPLVVFSRCLLASRSDLGARPRREAIKRRNDGEETCSETARRYNVHRSTNSRLTA
jgi:hypothetical protein